MSAVKASDSDGSSEYNSPAQGPMNTDPASYNEPNERPKPQQSVPLSKRIACVICRKRKLRCDGARPACGTCARLQHNCVYEETRRKSGPKRGYVKMLEERLAHVEGLLNPNGTTPQVPSVPTPITTISRGPANLSHLSSAHLPQSISTSPAQNPLTGAPQTNLSAQQSVLPDEFGAINLGNDIDLSAMDTLGATENIFELMALGMDEPLPPQSMMNELHTIYFERYHEFIPMIHRPRYIASLNYPPHLQPPLYLRYAVWTTAASMSPKYRQYAEVFYTRTRKYLEQVQMRGHGENIAALAFTQAWILVALYEYKVMFFPRAWLSAGIACRSAIMLQANIMDSYSTNVKHCLPPPSDWIEIEERRRTFWCAFCADRYASVGTGWPLTLDEIDIATNLPASEAAFDNGVEETTCSLSTALDPTGAKFVRKLSVFAGHILVVAMFGRIHSHLHRGDATAGGLGSIPPNFFERFRYLDNTIHTIMFSLPNHIKRPMGPMSPPSAELIMSIHASTICLHQATIFRTRKSPTHQSEFETSKQRCLQAASEIAKVMQSCSHFDMTAFNAFMSFCVYIAARCFVQGLRTSPDGLGLDPATRARLDFLLTALDNMKEDVPIAQSFLMQLEVDMANLLDEGCIVLEECAAGKPSPLSNISTLSDSEVHSDISQASPPGDIPPGFDHGSIGVVHPQVLKHQKNSNRASPYSRELKSADSVPNGPADIGDNGGVPRFPLGSWPPTSSSASTTGNDVEMSDGSMFHSDPSSVSPLSQQVPSAAHQIRHFPGHAETVGMGSVTPAFTAQPLDIDMASSGPDPVLTLRLKELQEEQQRLLQLHDQRQRALKSQQVEQQQHVLKQQFQQEGQLRQQQQQQQQDEGHRIMQQQVTAGMGANGVNGLDTMVPNFDMGGVSSAATSETVNSVSPKPWTPSDIGITMDFSLASYLQSGRYNPQL
ncbi:fungal-specific transcription factor domain-containing protein [Lipomyces chichibuensis]|uniref:fungal-specific transcription factor domain-containing protein n=1 Tax=Lipomyces chichibuensis TaxID=1546026 RepID=UPI0033433B49